MIETLVTAAITVSSILLLGYWFRYTCLLILTAKTVRDYTSEVVANIQLSFLGVQAELKETAPAEFDRLQASLDGDYAILTSLIKHAAAHETRIENRMLQIDYCLMGAWYRLSQTFSVGAARRALEEMSMVVAHFANSVGECAVASAA